jgi:nitroreductase
MEKPAPVDHPVHDLVRARWSPRVFADRPVEKDVLRSLFEAARWAPSSFNAQPWRFLVARRGDGDGWRRVHACLTEGNRGWTERAPVLGLTVARKAFEHNGKPNRHAWHDVGLAMAQLTLEATSRGLFVHQMAGLSAERARETWDIPAEFEPVTAFALGYAADASDVPEGERKTEAADRKRKPQSEIVFAGAWAKPFE